MIGSVLGRSLFNMTDRTGNRGPPKNSLSPTLNRVTTSEDRSLRSAYVEFIRSCYQNYPEARSFYEQLVDYIKPTFGNINCSLQKPRVYEVTAPPRQDLSLFSFPFDTVDWENPQWRPRVVVLEGLPSPDCIALLGIKCSIRPNFFIGHLFSSQRQNQQAGLYELPTLPSQQDNTVRIHFTSLVKSVVEGSDYREKPTKRSEIEEVCRQCEKDLFREGRYGATRFRSIDQYNGHFCSIEQTVSFTVAMSGEKWVGMIMEAFCWSTKKLTSESAVYLTDQGRNIENHRLPWSDFKGMPVGTLPIIQHNASSIMQNNTQNTKRASWDSLAQFHPLKNVVLKDDTDRRLLLADPFFLLSSLLTTSALSFNHLLSFLADSIADSQTVSSTQLEVKLERLRHYARTIDRIESRLSETTPLISRGGCPGWPRAPPPPETTDPQLHERKAALQRQLRADHVQLMRRCALMRRKCESATSLLVSYLQLLSSERGIAQAAELHRLSKLASFFVPLGFVASAFGMNIHELRSFPSVWVFVAVALAVSLTTFGAMYLSSWTGRWLEQGFGRRNSR